MIIYVRKDYTQPWRLIDYSEQQSEEYTLIDNNHFVIEIFTPVTVSPAFYELFMSIVETSNDHSSYLRKGMTTGYGSSYICNAATVRPYGFLNGGSREIAHVYLRYATTMGSHAFERAESLKLVSASQCSTIGAYAFSLCTTLNTIQFPNCRSIGSNAFYGCSALSSISFSRCSVIGSYAFQNCSSLRTANISGSSITIYNYAFGNCYSLSTVTLSVSGTVNLQIHSSAFYNASKLHTLTLKTSGVATLRNSNAFLKTSLYSGWYVQTGATSVKYTGSIYVPMSLASAYKTATNWVYFSSFIYGQ